MSLAFRCCKTTGLNPFRLKFIALNVPILRRKKKKRKNEQLPPSVFFSLKFLKFDNRSSSIFADRSCLKTSQDSAKRNDSHHGTSNIVIMVRLVHVCVEYYRKFSVSWTRTVCRSVCTLVNVLYACLYDCSSGVYKVQRALY